MHNPYGIKYLFMILIIIFFLFTQILKKTIKNEKNKFQSELTDLSTMGSKLNLAIEFQKIYSTLFEAASKGLTKRPINSFRNVEKSYKTHNKGIGICSIGKKENLYAKEFVEYYLKLGIKKIIIYDNNEINGEKFEDVLKEYIINEKVEIIDVRGFASAQFPSYMDCYKKYGNQFDFLIFIDFDDFITIKNNTDINTFLNNEKYNKCETIILNWVMYGDNNLVKYDNRTLIERFTKPKSNWSRGKSIIRTNISNLIISSTHIIGINIKYFCDSNGNRIFPKSFHDFRVPYKPEAYIKHFFTKTAEEFCNKINRGDAHFPNNCPEYLDILKGRIKTFFIFNSITNEKIKIIEKCSRMNIKMIIK